jgi:hypothetical protein
MFLDRHLALIKTLAGEQNRKREGLPKEKEREVLNTEAIGSRR